MKKHLPFFLSAASFFLFFLSFLQLNAQYNFQYLLAPTSGGVGASVSNTSDGGYIVAGYNQYASSTLQDMVLAKTNSNGTVQWSKKYGAASQNDECYCVRQTSDGGYILCGKGSGAYATVIKTNSSGAIQWSVNQSNSSLINKIQETKDGGFVFAGTRSIASGAYFFGKMNSAGTLLWSYESTSIPAVGTGSAGKVALQTMDKGYLFAGDIFDTTGTANDNKWGFFKTDSTGAMLWHKNYSPGKVHDVTLTTDSGFVAVGNVGGSIMSAGRFDKTGNIVWNNLYTFGSNADARAVKQTSDGGFILLIYTGLSDNGQLLKLDANGTVLWNKQINAGAIEFTFDAELALASDGGYVFAANKDNAGIYLGKASSAGTMACNTTTLTATKSVFTLTPSATTYTVSTAVFSPVSLASSSETITSTTYCTNIPLSLVMTYSNPLCYGDYNGTATATPIGGSGPFTYAWSDFGNTQTDYSLSFGTYSVTVTDGLGATATGAVTLVQPGNLSPYVTANPSGSICRGLCATLTANASGGTAPYTYNWNPGSSTTLVVCPASTTNYQLDVTDSHGCPESASAFYTQNIIQLPNGSISPATPSMCYGNGVTLTASGGNSYSWFSPVTSASASIAVNPTATITYSCLATNSSGCTKIYTNTVNVLTTPTVTVSASDSVYCLGGGSALYASGANTYSWNTGQTATSIFVSPSVTTTYSVTGTGSSGCTNKKSITITVIQSSPPSVGITPSATAMCEGGNITLSASGATAYAWSPGGQTATTIVVSPSSTSSYSLTGTNAGGCKGSTSVLLTVNPAPSVSATAASYTICSGTSTTLNATGGSSYVWQPGSLTGASVTVSPTTNINYTVTGTGGNGCTDTSLVTIAASPLLAISVSGNTTICNGSSTTLTASGGTAYSWSTTATTASIVVSPSAISSYTVNGTNSSGCTGKTIVTVTPHILSANAGTDLTITNCGGSVQLNATANYTAVTYSWSPSAGLSNASIANPSAQPQITTTYSVTVTDTCGQIIKDAVNVYVINSTSIPICLVTVDSLSQYNVIVWDKPAASSIDSFIIYREISTNNYQPIGSVSVDSLSIFMDTVRTKYFPNTGNPNNGTYRYKIETRDTCGNRSAKSPYHNTIFMINNSGTFSWQQLYTIEGSSNPVNNYLLMRDNNSTGIWDTVASVAGTQQQVNDPAYSTYQNTASWRVETEWLISCSPSVKYPLPTATNLNSSRSNVFRLNTPTSVSESANEYSIRIYPNPARGLFSIYSAEKIYSAEIVNVLGEKIDAISYAFTAAPVDLSSQENGIYFLQLKTNHGVVNKKIIIRK